ncbi:MAG: hypothetical protein KJ066_19610 [Acidobacteria bacterium]|nr:hypothetical protein [Acidobacteriota bacterium]
MDRSEQQLLQARAETKYVMECFGADGALKWREEFPNLVVTEGRNALLNGTFDAPAGSVAWYVGLVTDGGSNSYAAGDTLASHAGWAEATGYTGNRKVWTKNGSASAGSMSNSSSPASFAITANASIAGAFLASAETGTVGTLYGVGAFTAGTRAVQNGDTLNVTVTPSVTAS